MRHRAALGPAALVAALALACAPASAAQTLSPLPASDYSVRSACPQPAPGHTSCLAMELVPETPAARAHSHPLGMTLQLHASAGARHAAAACEVPSAAMGCFGMRPEDLHNAYELPNEASSKQTIALVDAYNDPTAEADLEAYDNEFHLPACTAENGCFEQVNEHGQTSDLPFPKTTLELEEARTSSPEQAEAAQDAEGWTIEESLDIETARAICQSCKLLLVEASSDEESALQSAEQAAVTLGATEISNSWGGPECVEELPGERECVSEDEDRAFEHPGIVITVAAGDSGYLNWASPESSERGFVDFPASSPHVVAVGGTRLELSEHDKRSKETVWNDGGESSGVRDGYGAGGGGCSEQFTAAPWQQSVSDWSSVGCGNHRSVADVSADADPYTGLAVYDSSSSECRSAYEEEVNSWCTIGGTSMASPLIASVFALAGGAHGVEYPAHTLYENLAGDPTSLYDVTEGSNGECDLPFDSGTGQSRCTSSEESKASCASHLSCTAAVGYDGPTGVGTPKGLTAFEPPTGGGKEPEGSSEGGASKGGGEGSKGGEEATHGAGTPSSPPPSPGSGEGSSTGSGSSDLGTPPQLLVHISGLALTLKAIIALNSSRPRIPQLSFTFASNLATSVRVSLQKLVRRRRHTGWQAFGHTLKMAAVAGHNTKRLSEHGVLSDGTYRLMLTPANGAACSIQFRIG